MPARTALIWWPGADVVHQRGDRGLDSLGAVDGLGDQTDLRGHPRVELLAGDEVASRGPAGEPGQQGQRDDRWRHPDACLGERERAVRTRHRDIGRTDETETAGPHMAIDGDDDGQWQLQDVAQQCGELTRPVLGDVLR